MRLLFSLLLLTFSALQLTARDSPESLDSTFQLQEVKINASQGLEGIGFFGYVKDQIILAGKKNELLDLAKTDGNKITNQSRQVFAKIPGIFVWENESSGTQINVSTRGLSPNRSWEFNVRQNGYDITPDPFGYPEAYYNPPLEAVSKVQVIRGAASLQYGTQFGGLLNYILAQGSDKKKISVESQNSTGTNGLVSTFNSVGGTVGKLNYYSYYNFKRGNGWRDNNDFSVHNAFVHLQYTFHPKVRVIGEYTFSRYINQQPGGLTDSLFHDNPKQSLRSRNWFNVNWHIASIQVEYKPKSNLSISWKNNVVIGERNSIGFNKAVTVKDSINASTLAYNARQIDRDGYKTFNSEARFFYTYKLLQKEQALSAGVRTSYANTLRRQLGKGDNGTDFNLALLQDSFPRSLNFTTTNVALFAENMFHFGKNFFVTPGIRYEFVRNTADGRIDIQKGLPVLIPASKKQYHIFLAGIGLQYDVFGTTNFYANVTQAFRPVLYSDLTPSSTTDVIDNNLKASSGINIDFGYRGTYKDFLSFDFTGYYLLYKNRIGNVLRYAGDNPSNASYIFKTNLGDSRSIGMEGFAEVDLIKPFTSKHKYGTVSVFTSLSVTDAQYKEFTIYKASGSAPNIQISEINLKGKKVEYAPLYNHRFGLTYKVKEFSTSFQVSLTGSVFTDAENTEVPNAAGTVGKLNGYTLLDWSFSYYFLNHFNVKGGINNLTNARYATRRSGGYPGPGILPGDGLTWFVSFGIKF
jgi:Fe(3+) dicitrate transport protein